MQTKGSANPRHPIGQELSQAAKIEQPMEFSARQAIY
jgi:hypothetical protein